MGELLHRQHGGEVQGVAGIGLKGADTPLAEDDPVVAPGHDVLGAHEPLLNGGGQAPLEQDGLGGLAKLLEQVEVLHVPGSHLNHVHAHLEHLHVVGGHDLGDDGQAGGLLCLLEQADAVVAHTLEGIGGGAGLEGAAPQGGGAAGLYRLGHPHNLRLALHRAGPGDHRQPVPAHAAAIGQLNHRVLRVVLPVGLLIGLRDPHDPLHAGQQGQLLLVDVLGVALRAQDGGLRPLGHHDFDAALLHGVYGGLQLLRGKLPLHNDNHILTPFTNKEPAAAQRRPRVPSAPTAERRKIPDRPVMGRQTDRWQNSSGNSRIHNRRTCA